MKRIILLEIVVMTALLFGCSKEPEPAATCTTIKVGHVGHDHHLALFVAADHAAQYEQAAGIELKPIEPTKYYELYDQGRKVADVEIVKVGGGSKMPTAIAQNVIEIGFGGVAAVLASIDSGAPIKLISPLHYKGDMLVVKPDFPADSWEEFVQLARSAEKPIRIGYKNPVAVAKVVLEEALRHEGITFGGNPAQKDLQVHLINVKGGGKLNVALGGDLIDGYAGNNPFPAIAVDKHLGKIVCDLEELPPGTFRNHPCCCIAANTRSIREKPEAIIDLLTLFLQANETINSALDKAVTSAVRWIGTTPAVERLSIPTSGYSMQTSNEWRRTMAEWIEAMNELQVFKGALKGQSAAEVAKHAYDFSLLEKAEQKLAERKKLK